VKLENEGKKIGSSDLKKAIRQKPNTRILGVARFHLGLYNLSGADEERRFNRWLRSIGEAPVIYNPYLQERTVEQLRLYLNNKGYYEAEVSDTVFFKKKKAFITYHVTPGPVTRIRNYSNQLSGTERIENMIQKDAHHTLIQSGAPLDVDLLEKERERLTHLLQSNGYYNFSKNILQYYADTLHKAQQADLTLSDQKSLSDSMAFREYKIGAIRIYLDYNPLIDTTESNFFYQKLKQEDYEVFYHKSMYIKPEVIFESIQFVKGELYDVNKVSRSYSRLQALNLFKFINIIFKESTSDDAEPQLDCEILLTPMKRQSYNIFIEGTNNSGNIGVGGNLSYNHKNLLHGGENLTLSLWGALKKEEMQENEIFSTTEVGAELRFVTPQFWLPVRLSEFRRDYAPKTSISLSYSQEHTQFYNRRVASAKFGYIWRRKDNRWRYNFDLLDLNYVMMPFVNQSFIEGLKNQYVKSAYTDHMILSSNFSATYSGQREHSTASFNYFRGNLETSGNLLLGLNKLLGKERTQSGGESYYNALGVRYAQFIKADGEYRFNHIINRVNSVVYRLFVGCGYPYGNMKALPFEEAYYCGGANGIRAWHARTLGPGAYAPSQEEKIYPNSVGDVKLEANIEYRFKLFWLLEGALFLDAGNVWNINKYVERPGVQLGSDFLNQIAVGTGFGLRVNVTFFLLRFDMGLKLHDPALAKGERFVLFNRNGGFNRSVFNIAIGYPF
jgi:outer membrane protein assembly factor BamA